MSEQNPVGCFARATWRNIAQAIREAEREQIETIQFELPITFGLMGVDEKRAQQRVYALIIQFALNDDRIPNIIEHENGVTLHLTWKDLQRRITESEEEKLLKRYSQGMWLDKKK
jgi:hypothetical protein